MVIRASKVFRSNMEKFYRILGVDRNATSEEVRRAFRKLSLECHPDKHVKSTDEEKEAARSRFHKISEAFRFITNPEELIRKVSTWFKVSTRFPDGHAVLSSVSFIFIYFSFFLSFVINPFCFSPSLFS